MEHSTSLTRAQCRVSSICSLQLCFLRFATIITLVTLKKSLVKHSAVLTVQTVIGGPRRQKDKISRGKHITLPPKLHSAMRNSCVHWHSKLLFALIYLCCSLVVSCISKLSRAKRVSAGIKLAWKTHSTCRWSAKQVKLTPLLPLGPNIALYDCHFISQVEIRPSSDPILIRNSGNSQPSWIG